MEKSTLILLGCLLSLVSSLMLAPIVINIAKKLKAGQVILKYVIQHESKSGTATMGGFIFLIPAIIFTLVFGYSETVLVACLTVTGYTLLGFLDDYIKIHYHKNEGLKPYQKIIGQGGIAIIISLYCYKNMEIGSSVYLPFTNGNTVDLGMFYPFFVFFIYIATTNAVNLTDGLDGLAGGVSAVYFLFFGIIGYVLYSIAEYNGEMLMSEHLFGQAMLSACFLGGLVGYLCFNHYPASVMMGDTGSLGLGGAVATVAVFTKNPFLILLVGIMFVVSCISIIIQVAHYKRTKKRVFLMAPYHHHLEKKGYGEGKIGMWYITVTVIGGLLSLISM